MGFFDKFKNGSSSEPEENAYIPQSEQEAFIAVMYSCLMVDGHMSEAESDMLSRVFTLKSFFKYYSLKGLFQPAMAAYGTFGSKKVIDYSVPFISDENKPTLLCMVLDIAMFDGDFKNDEKSIIEYLISMLEMPEDLASKIIEVMMYKNKWNILMLD